MPIIITCTCGKRFRAKDELAGKRTACPACGQPLTIGSQPNAEVVTNRDAQPHPKMSGEHEDTRAQASAPSRGQVSRRMTVLQWGLLAWSATYLGLGIVFLAMFPDFAHVMFSRLLLTAVPIGEAVLAAIAAIYVSKNSKAWKCLVSVLVITHGVGLGWMVFDMKTASVSVDDLFDRDWLSLSPVGLYSLMGANFLFLTGAVAWSWIRSTRVLRPSTFAGQFLVAICATALVALSTVPLVISSESAMNANRDFWQDGACKSNLHAIGLALRIHEADHGQLPHSLTDLEPALPAAKLTCVKDKTAGTYVYLLEHLRNIAPRKEFRLSLFRIQDWTGTPLVWEDRPRHAGHINVCFADSHVESIPPATLRELLDNATPGLLNALRGASQD